MADPLYLPRSGDSEYNLLWKIVGLLAGGSTPTPPTPPEPPFSAAAVTIPGDVTYLGRTGNFTGAANGTKFTASLWLTPLGADDQWWIFLANDNGNGIEFIRRDDSRIQIVAKDTLGNQIVRLEQDSAKVLPIKVSSGMTHVICSFDNSIPGAYHLLINGVDALWTDAPPFQFTGDGTPANYTNPGAGWGILGRWDDTWNVNACVSQLYVSFSDYFDLSVPANLALFYDPSGPPGELTSVGSPILYLNDPASTFNTNSGSGGILSVRGPGSPFTDCTL